MVFQERRRTVGYARPVVALGREPESGVVVKDVDPAEGLDRELGRLLHLRLDGHVAMGEDSLTPSLGDLHCRGGAGLPVVFTDYSETAEAQLDELLLQLDTNRATTELLSDCAGSKSPAEWVQDEVSFIAACADDPL